MSATLNLKIVLVEPAGERNIGSIARIMKNMELNQLVIVNPQCDPFSEDAQLMAVHGLEILSQAQICHSLTTALADCQRVIATTARPRAIPTPLEIPKQALSWLIAENISSALIFGPEDRGLSNQELSYAQRFVCIPANPTYSSLNLAQAVTICAYEIYQARQSLNCSKINSPERLTDLASLEQLEGYYQHLESVLLQVHYLYPHTAKVKMEKFRRIFNRSNLQTQELSMLRGILRQIEWAIKKK
jgi:tRNA/rRNA methyltransferase